MASKKKINEKMSKKKTSSFPYKTLSFLTMLLMALLVYIDISQHGSWKDSRTNKALRDSGIDEYTHRALNRTKEGLLWVDARFEESFPGVHKSVADFSGPYVQLTKDLGLIGYNMCVNFKNAVVAKYPVIIESIDSYAPGLIDASQKTAGNIWTTSTLYVNKGVAYLKEEVFVGQLSPENMQKVLANFALTTQQKATECYHWLYEKVQTTIK